jgi:hypothetical protein
MIKFFKAVLLALFGGVFAAYGVANRHVVEFVTDPFVPAGFVPAEGKDFIISYPLSVFLFAALLAGVLIGGMVVWQGQGKWRRAARQRAREANELRREVDRLGQQLRAFEEPRLISMPSSSGALTGPGGSASNARSWLTH